MPHLLWRHIMSIEWIWSTLFFSPSLDCCVKEGGSPMIMLFDPNWFFLNYLFTFLRFDFTFIWVYNMYICSCVCCMCVGAWCGQMSMSDPLTLELHEVVSCLMWGAGNWTWMLWKARSTLNHWAIFSAPVLNSLRLGFLVYLGTVCLPS